MVAAHEGHFMVKPEGNLRSLGRCGIFIQSINKCSKHLQLFIAGVVNDPMQGHLLQAPADFQNGADLLFAEHPTIVVHNGHKYNRKYLAEHEAELADYRAAKATMAELLGGEKLPKMDVLKEKRRQLAARKKALYLEYRKAQQDMRELVAVKGSVDHLRGLTDNQRNKEQAR